MQPELLQPHVPRKERCSPPTALHEGQMRLTAGRQLQDLRFGGPARLIIAQEKPLLLHQSPRGISAAEMSERSSFMNRYNTEITLLVFFIYLKCAQLQWQLPTRFSIENFTSDSQCSNAHSPLGLTCDRNRRACTNTFGSRRTGLAPCGWEQPPFHVQG